MKKLLLILSVVVMLCFIPTTESATYKKVYATTQLGTYLGHKIYYVKLHNNTYNTYVCRVVATNGANHLVYLYPKRSTRWMKINDRNALYKWECVPQ